jgi:hypothetical protein
MTIGIDPVAKGHRDMYLFYAIKKAVGVSAHGFLGNQLFL